MIDRLVQQGLLERTEDPVDRRRKSLAATPRALSFMGELETARSTDYEVGLTAVPPDLLAQMTTVLERVVLEIEKPASGYAQRSARSGPKER